jgi:hypothetical protein
MKYDSDPNFARRPALTVVPVCLDEVSMNHPGTRNHHNAYRAIAYEALE